jgi:hypothetical protein
MRSYSLGSASARWLSSSSKRAIWPPFKSRSPPTENKAQIGTNCIAFPTRVCNRLAMENDRLFFALIVVAGTITIAAVRAALI